jgi:hypothetical protein
MRTLVIFLAVCTLGSSHGVAQAGSASVFTYQGQLKEAGVPANGSYDLLFRIFGQAEGGEEIPGADGGLLVQDVPVMHGLFTVDLDFGPDVFQRHDELWLEIAVKPAEFAPADFTTLVPRQRLSAAPWAIVAESAKTAGGGSLAFGGLGAPTIGVNPDFSGLTATDAFGMRIMSTTQARQCSGSGEPCWFDQHCPEGETCEPCDACGAVPDGAGAMFFGLQNRMSISTEPGLPGLAVSGAHGIYLVGGTRVCSEPYPPYGEVLYCEADSDCYGCCTTLKRCSGSGASCESDEDCPVGACNDSGNACHKDRDCEPGGCLYSPGTCYSTLGCTYGDACANPYPEGCTGGETCEEDFPCTTRCYSDEDCPDEGSFCDYPVPGTCVVPEGRCSGSQAPCQEDEDCPAGYCTERPERQCWNAVDCISFGGYTGFSVYDYGPCVAPEECVHPDPVGPVAVNFGHTGVHSIGFDPLRGGLTATDPEGLRLVSTANTCSGTGAICETDEDCPAGGCSDDEYPCRDDAICGFGNTCTNPTPETCESYDALAPVKLLFGPTNDRSIGTDSGLTGLVVKDPVGLRLMSPAAEATGPTKLLLGPTDDYFIGFNVHISGTHINDPDGIHLTAMTGPEARQARAEPFGVRLFFGLGNDTSIGTLIDAGGLVLSDPGGVRILNSADPAENALIFGLNGAGRASGTRIDTGIASGGLRFLASDFIFTGGPVGIGTTPASSTSLDVEKNLPVGTTGAAAIFNRTGSDGVILDFQRDGASVGDISVSRGIVSYNSFTGSHLAWTDEPIERGALVRLTGSNRYLHGRPSSEIVYGVEQSTVANDPSCLGAYLTEHDLASAAGAGGAHLIMAEGNGEMWVVDTGGDIRPGDFLISSDVPGCAMKDDPLRFPVGYVVARAAEGVRWESVESGAGALKKAKVSVLFESLVRGGDAEGLAGVVERLGSVVESQRRTITALQEQVGKLQDLVERLPSPDNTRPPATGAAGKCTGGTK